jgi:hypothetical protein
MLKPPFMSRAASADFYQSRSAGWVLLCIGMALWLLCNPYSGIWHDARVYAVMAMRRLDPSAYTNDPWFLFGSQDGFSIFSHLYAPVIASLGLGHAAMLTALLGGLCFVAAVKRFAQSHAEGKVAALLMLLLIGLPLAYCPNDWTVLYVAESFATARPFAIAAALVAIAVQHDRGWKPALIWHGLAFALHPLIAIGAIAVAFCVANSYRWTGAMTVVVFVCVGVLGMLGWGPMQPMGTPWLTLVEHTAGVVVLSGEFDDAAPVVLIAALLLGGAGFGHESLRPWYGATLFVGLAGFFTSLLASCCYPAHLLLELQTWRALWLAVIYSIVALVDLGHSGYFLPARRNATLLGIALILHYGIFGGWGLLIYVLFLRFVSHFSADNLFPETRKWIGKAINWMAVLLIILALPGLWIDLYGRGLAIPLWWSLSGVAILDGLLINGGFSVLAYFLWLGFGRVRGHLRVTLIAIVLAAIGTAWDHRLPKHRQSEAAYGPASSIRVFANLVKKGDVVYWPHSVERVWFELGTSSYAGSVQAVGIVFNERFALELERRLRHAVTALADVDDRQLDQVFRNRTLSRRWNLHAYEIEESGVSLALTPSGLKRLCSDPVLDWVINRQHFPELASAVKQEVSDAGEQSISLYDCRHVRRQDDHA